MVKNQADGSRICKYHWGYGNARWEFVSLVNSNLHWLDIEDTVLLQQRARLRWGTVLQWHSATHHVIEREDFKNYG